MACTPFIENTTTCLIRDDPDSESGSLPCQNRACEQVLQGIEALQMPFPVDSPAVAECLQQLPGAESLQRGHTASIATFLVCQFHRNLPELPQRLIVDPLSGSDESADQTLRTERFVNRWITNNTIPIKNRIQEIWTATAATPAIFRAPAITPTTKNISA